MDLQVSMMVRSIWCVFGSVFGALLSIRPNNEGGSIIFVGGNSTGFGFWNCIFEMVSGPALQDNLHSIIR